MRNAGSGPVPGQDSQGRFVKGNRLGRGRPWGIPRAVLHLTYRQALHACSPQDLFEITRRAVADAKKGDHFARMYLVKAMGLDSLRITLNPHPHSPVPTYHLDALDDGELEALATLSNKMLVGPE